jgi:2-amino-4-hydroxy-6-hydroxymethyldihydropteridine diphosphokinase
LTTAYLSLGSNLGDRAANLRQALECLETAGVQIVRRSSISETEPQELREQPWFLNQVVEIGTTLSPIELLARIRDVERELGRQRVVAKGPRTIDIDILLYEDAIIDTPELQIPHPRLADRRFVLEPLAELAPDLRHPATGRTISDMLAALEGQTSKRWDSLNDCGSITH